MYEMYVENSLTIYIHYGNCNIQKHIKLELTWW